MIPKIIHLIWLPEFSQIPEKYNSNIQSIVEKNPGWQVKKWGEESIRVVVGAIGEEYLNKYDSFQLLHQKVDFARYAILYSFGGVSIDVDVVALKSMDNTPHLNDSDFIVSNNSIDSFINNATILVSKSNLLLLELLDTIVSNNKYYSNKNFRIWQTTGPGVFTTFVRKHKKDITIIDHTYLEPCSGMNKYCKIPDNAILDHQHEASWVSPLFKNLVRAHYFVIQYKYVLTVISITLILLFIFRKKL